MINGDSIQCSHCGSNNSVDFRFAACVATSQYNRNNYPAPNTYVTANDDIRLWRIPMCRTCIPSGYRSFLRNRLKKIATQLGWCSFLFIVGALAVYFKMPGPPPNVLVTPLHWLLAAAIALALIAGVVGMPVCTVMWLVNFSRLKNLERSGVVPAKQIDNSFIGEGQRIINALAPERGKPLGKVWGEFSLPEHKKIEVTPEEKKKLGSPIRERDIVAVGKTINEMAQQLPSQWKSLWEQHNKKQLENGKTQ